MSQILVDFFGRTWGDYIHVEQKVKIHIRKTILESQIKLMEINNKYKEQFIKEFSIND